jgi:PKD repeat protein
MRKNIIIFSIAFILISTIFLPLTIGNDLKEKQKILTQTMHEIDSLKATYNPPFADFNYIANGKNVFFDASSSYDIDGNITSYEWDFGDGEQGSGKYVNYTYCCFNTYLVVLTVTDNDNLTNQTSKYITIVNDPPLPPTDPEPENGKINVDINVIISWVGEDPNGDPLTYNVYFEKDDADPDILVSENQSLPYYDIPEPLEYETDYYWRIEAWDPYEACSQGPIWHFTTGSAPNNPPDQPSDPIPLNGSYVEEVFIELGWRCSDPDDDELVYDIYLEAEDPDPDILISDDQNETTFQTMKLQYKTIYYWQIIVKDEDGASTAGPVWNFKTKPETNEPPTAPIINGPLIGNAGKFNTYTIVSEDPDNDDVYYQVDWGDGIVDPWIGPFISNKFQNIIHRWGFWGVYTIRARTKDVYGEISEWGELQVTMPKGILNFNSHIYELFARLNFLLPILKLILQ